MTDDQQHVANVVDRYSEEVGCDVESSCHDASHPRAKKWDYATKTMSDEDDPTSCALVTDDGTMPENVQALRDVVIGRKIVAAEKRTLTDAEKATLAATRRYYYSRYSQPEALFLTLDNGTVVVMVDSNDCCAYTTLDKFLLNPLGVEHAILGVGTEDGFTKWHIYADFGDVMALEVDWSCGNPFYYGYGFDIMVIPLTIEGEVIPERTALEPGC